MLRASRHAAQRLRFAILEPPVAAPFFSSSNVAQIESRSIASSSAAPSSLRANLNNRSTTENADEAALPSVLEEPSYEYVAVAQSSKQSDTYDAGQDSVTFTSEQISLYRILRNVLKDERQELKNRSSNSKSGRRRKADRLVSLAQSLAAQPVQKPADRKGKAKEVTDERSIRHQYSVPTWALLLRYATRCGDGATFMKILVGISQWKNRAALEKMEEQHQRVLSVYALEDEPGMMYSASDTTFRRTLGFAERTLTFNQLEDLAIVLAIKLKSTGNLRLVDPSTVPQSMQSSFLTNLLARMEQQTDSQAGYSNAQSAAAIIKQPMNFQKASTQHADDIRASYQLRWPSSSRTSKDVRTQVRLLLGVLQEAHRQSLTPRARKSLIERRWREHVGATASDAEEDLHRESVAVDPASNPPFPALGSAADPASIFSLLLNREDVAHAVTSSWLSRHRPGSSGGPMRSLSQLSDAPPAWLLLLILHSHAARGDVERVHELIESFLHAAGEKQASLASNTDLLERGSQPTELPDLRFYKRSLLHSGTPRKIGTAHDKDGELPTGQRLLNMLMRAYQTKVVDAASGRAAFAQAWRDCQRLCGAKSRSQMAGQSSSTSTSATLPLLTPNEDTILLLLSLLRFDRGRATKGLSLVREAEDLWARPALKPRRIKVSASPDATGQDVGGRHEDMSLRGIPFLHLSLRTAKVLLGWASDNRWAKAASEAVELAHRWRWAQRDHRLGFNVRGTMDAIRARKAQAAKDGQPQRSIDEWEAALLKQLREDEKGTSFERLKHPAMVWHQWRRSIARAKRRGLLGGKAEVQDDSLPMEDSFSSSRV